MQQQKVTGRPFSDQTALALFAGEKILSLSVEFKLTRFKLRTIPLEWTYLINDYMINNSISICYDISSVIAALFVLLFFGLNEIKTTADVISYLVNNLS